MSCREVSLPQRKEGRVPFHPWLGLANPNLTPSSPQHLSLRICHHENGYPATTVAATSTYVTFCPGGPRLFAFFRSFPLLNTFGTAARKKLQYHHRQPRFCCCCNFADFTSCTASPDGCAIAFSRMAINPNTIIGSKDNDAHVHAEVSLTCVPTRFSLPPPPFLDALSCTSRISDFPCSSFPVSSRAKHLSPVPASIHSARAVYSRQPLLLHADDLLTTSEQPCSPKTRFRAVDGIRWSLRWSLRCCFCRSITWFSWFLTGPPLPPPLLQPLPHPFASSVPPASPRRKAVPP